MNRSVSVTPILVLILLQVGVDFDPSDLGGLLLDDGEDVRVFELMELQPGFLLPSDSEIN